MSASKHPNAYHEDPRNLGHWFYGDLRIQSDIAAHEFVTRYALSNLQREGRILDIATGEGALARQLLDGGMRVSVTTWNDKCRVDVPMFRVNLDHPFVLSDVGSLPYDLVCCIEIIEHLENPARFLRDAARLIVPGGTIILSTPNVESAQARLQWLTRGYPSIFGEAEVKKNRHIAMMWRHGLEHLIDLAGLDVIEKHLLGRFSMRPGLRSVAKRLAYAAMGMFLPGDIRGTTRLYVLRAGERVSGCQGPEDVY